MKILWLCNLVLPELCAEFGFKKPFAGGWLSGMWNELKKDSRYELAICIPIKDAARVKDGNYEGYKYFSFQWQGECDGQNEQIKRFREIIRNFNPDIIHIWGTEYIHTNSMLKACDDEKIIEKALINIQGLLYKYTECYKWGLDSDYSDTTYESMIARQEYELDSLRMAQYVSGRTEWDKEGALQINPNVKYYHCGEILRDSFYKNLRWDYTTCKKHTILISQANYPIKGFHLAIKSLAKLKIEYPNLEVRVCGQSPMGKEDCYSEIISGLINSYEMNEVIKFVGPKSEQEMLVEYLNANVFLSPSVIENSSNSVCEALSLGVPIVSSCVGGMESIIEDSCNGLLYNLEDEEKAVEEIRMILENKDVAEHLSKNAIISSTRLNGKKECSDTLKSIYSSIYCDRK